MGQQRTTDFPTNTHHTVLDESDGPAEAQAARSEEQSGSDPKPSGHELRAVPPPREAGSRESGKRRADSETAAGGPDTAALDTRLERLEKQNRRLKWGIVGILLMLGYLSYEKFAPQDIIVRQTLMESEEIKLVDTSGQTRFFLRMYSRVPVLQLLDATGKPRMSLGLRFDDTPFIDLSDKAGNTRATFEMTAEDKPTLRLFDEKGENTFTVK